jgi:hypothetical protein
MNQYFSLLKPGENIIFNVAMSQWFILMYLSITYYHNVQRHSSMLPFHQQGRACLTEVSNAEEHRFVVDS